MIILQGFVSTVVISVMTIINLCVRSIERMFGVNRFVSCPQVKWRKTGHSHSLLKLRDPLEVTALLATVLSKISGDISKQEKEMLLVLFRCEFDLSEDEASDLLLISNFLFENCKESMTAPDQLMQQSLSNFTVCEARAAVGLLELVMTINVSNAVDKRYFVGRVMAVFDQQFKIKGKW